MSSIIVRPPPGIDFQRQSKPFQSSQSSSHSEIPETPRLGCSQENPIIINDKDENDNRNYIAKLWENVRDLEDNSDYESAPKDLAQVSDRYPSKLPPNEDKEQDAVIENLPIINSVASTDGFPLCNRQPSSLEEDKEDVDVEIIESLTSPQELVGISLSQATDSGAAIPTSKHSTPFALDYVERLPIEQREQYAPFKFISKQDTASGNTEMPSSTFTISKTQTVVEDKQHSPPSTVTPTKLKRNAPADETVSDVRKSGRKRIKTWKAREEDYGVDDASLKGSTSKWPVESIEVREMSLDNRELVYLINWKPSVVRCKSSKQLEGQLQETLKEQVTLKFGVKAWFSWTTR